MPNMFHDAVDKVENLTKNPYVEAAAATTAVIAGVAAAIYLTKGAALEEAAVAGAGRTVSTVADESLLNSIREAGSRGLSPAVGETLVGPGGTTSRGTEALLKKAVPIGKASELIAAGDPGPAIETLHTKGFRIGRYGADLWDGKTAMNLSPSQVEAAGRMNLGPTVDAKANWANDEINFDGDRHSAGFPLASAADISAWVAKNGISTPEFKTFTVAADDLVSSSENTLFPFEHFFPGRVAEKSVAGLDKGMISWGAAPEGVMEPFAGGTYSHVTPRFNPDLLAKKLDFSNLQLIEERQSTVTTPRWPNTGAGAGLLAFIAAKSAK